MSMRQNHRAAWVRGMGLGGLACILACALPDAAAQPLPQPRVGKPAAWVANSGFDIADQARHPIAWAVEGNTAGVKVVNLKDYRTAGLASLEVTDEAGSSVSVRSRRITAVPGGSYTATANVFGKTGQPASLYLEFWSFEGKRISETHTAPAPGAEWQSVRIEAAAPAEAAHVTLHIYAPIEAEGVSYWDKASLQLAPAPYDPKLGAARELFLDDHRIDSARHVGRVVHPAKVTAAPVIRAEHPWESSAYIYGSVYRIDDVYRMWYTAYNGLAPNYHLAYAESRDGLTWEKPNLGMVEFEGSKANNLVPGYSTIAYNPDAPPDHRYATMSFIGGVPNETMGYYVWFSPDGYTWTPASEKPALLDGDVCNIIYDPGTKQYIATIKKRMFTARTPGIYERTAFLSTSSDAVTWSAPRIAVSGDYADDGAAEALGGLEAQIYGMPVVPYESTYVGFPWLLYITNYTEGDAAFAGDGPVDVQIASSRDLMRWTRPVRDPIIRTGLPGSWNDGAHYTASNILVEDETITMYYGAFNLGHGGSDMEDPGRGRNVGQSGRATWRRDGWVSLTNGATPGLGDPGVVVTKPIVFDGAALHVNATVRPEGSLTIEVLDANGDPLPGYSGEAATPIRGDHLDATVTFANGRSLAELAGQEVRLRFTLVNTDLFSYWVTP